MGETAEMIVMPVLKSRIKIADITDLAFPHGKDPQRSAAPGLVLQLEQPARQNHPPSPLSPGASGSEALLRSSVMSVEANHAANRRTRPGAALRLALVRP